MRRVRLLKVIVEPTFVSEDESGTLSEVSGEPIAVTAAAWPGFPRSFLASLERYVQGLQQVAPPG